MEIQLTTRQAVEWGANKLLDNQQLTAERKREIKQVTEFNLLTTAFNASTILIVAAVAAAVLFAYSAAFTLGAIGLFVRYATEKELNKYTLPFQPPAEQGEAPQQGAGAALWGRLREAFNTTLLRHALHQARPEEKIENMFHNVGLPRQEGWIPNPVIFDDFALWKNKMDVPVAVAVQAAAPVQGEQAVPRVAPPAEAAPAVPGVVARGLAGFVNLVMQQAQQPAQPPAQPPAQQLAQPPVPPPPAPPAAQQQVPVV